MPRTLGHGRSPVFHQETMKSRYCTHTVEFVESNDFEPELLVYKGMCPALLEILNAELYIVGPVLTTTSMTSLSLPRIRVDFGFFHLQVK